MSEFNPPFDFAALVRSRQPSGKFICTISKQEPPADFPASRRGPAADAGFRFCARPERRGAPASLLVSPLGNHEAQNQE